MNTVADESSHARLSAAADQPASPGILVETLLHHPVVILATAALFVVGAYFYLDHATPLYSGLSRIYVDQEIKVIGDDPEEGVMTRQDNYLYTQAEVMRSSPVLSKALKALDTESMQTFVGAENPQSLLQGGVEVEVGKTDGIINVSFKSPDSVEAADVVNAVVDAYIAFHAEQKRDAATALLKLLQEDLVRRDADIAEKYRRLMEFKRQNENLAFGSDETSNIIVRQMERLQTQLSDAKVMTRVAKHFYERAQSLADDAVAMRQLVEAWRVRNANYAPAKRIASPQPDQLFVQDQLGILQQEYLVAQQREEELAEQCQAQREQVLLLNNQLAQYDQLQSEYERAKEPSDILEKRINELSIAEGVGGLTVTVLEQATPATVPSDPKKVRITAIALLLGVCGGFGLGAVRTISDQRLRSSRDISALLHLPVLGTIPRIKSPLRSGIARARMVRICPTSSEAEAFRRLRTPLLFSGLNAKAKTILVTSPVSGDGKTTMVSNLGLALARAGQKVLIVDADCHAPRQHRIFKKDRQEKGLSSVLAGQTSLEEAIEPTGTENLDILTCGPSVCNTTEMLSGRSFKQLIATLASRYDRVLIDSSPVLSCTDAQVLAAQTDGVVIVLRAETSTRKDSIQTCAELTDVGARLLGIVVNGTSLKHDNYRYGGYRAHSSSVQAVSTGGRDVEIGKNVPVEPLFSR